MLSISVVEKGGVSKRLDFQKDEISIGRVQGNDVVLPRSNVSKKHARIEVRDSNTFVLDLDSTNGTFVNGKRIAAPQILRAADKIQIGDFFIQITEINEALDAYQPLAASSQGGKNLETDGLGTYEEANDQKVRYPRSERNPSGLGNLPVEPKPTRSQATIPKPTPPVKLPPREPITPAKRSELAEQAEQYSALLNDVRQRLQSQIQPSGDTGEELDAFKAKVSQAVREIVGQIQVPPTTNSESLIKDVENEILGFGPLDEFFADDLVSEIMINGAHQIYLGYGDQIQQSPKAFSSDAALTEVIERLLAPLGRHADESCPIVDARLTNGSRANIVIPPLSTKGPSLTIRKPKRQTMNLDQLVAFGTLTRGMADFLDMCLTARKNVVISGMYGSGRTTLLNCLAARIPDGERIITIEDIPELELPQEHCVSLTTRAPDNEGKGQISVRDLVQNSLRMNPNRIVVGECLGTETLDMVAAMNSGYNFFFTLHANSPIDCLARLENMVQGSGASLPLKAFANRSLRPSTSLCN